MAITTPANAQLPRKPRRRDTALEPLRAMRDFGACATLLPGLIKLSPKGDRRPILLLPGYGGADGSMAGLRYFLSRLNYNSYALNLGRNIDTGAQRIRSVDDANRFRATMVEQILKRVDDIHRETGEKVTLIGWSLGGVYAVDVGQQRSDKIRHVITLGAPFGDPRGTSLFMLMRRLSRSKVPIEGQDFAGWNRRAHLADRSPAIDVVFSPQDGIVSTDIAGLSGGNKLRYHRVNSSHISFSYNPSVYLRVASLLASAN